MKALCASRGARRKRARSGSRRAAGRSRAIPAHRPAPARRLASGGEHGEPDRGTSRTHQQRLQEGVSSICVTIEESWASAVEQVADTGIGVEAQRQGLGALEEREAQELVHALQDPDRVVPQGRGRRRRRPALRTTSRGAAACAMALRSVVPSPRRGSRATRAPTEPAGCPGRSGPTRPAGRAREPAAATQAIVEQARRAPAPPDAARAVAAGAGAAREIRRTPAPARAGPPPGRRRDAGAPARHGAEAGARSRGTAIHRRGAARVDGGGASGDTAG